MLSINQEGCLYGELFAQLQSLHVAPNHSCHGLFVRGPLDITALNASLADIVARHDVLRTSFGRRGSVILSGGDAACPFVCRVHDHAPLTVVHHSVEGVRGRERWRRIRMIAAAESLPAFDYERPPLMRVVLVRINPLRHVLVFITHHLISDGWSYQLLRKELECAYGARIGVGTERLPVLPIQYADFARSERMQLQGPTLDRLLAYWREYWNTWEPHVISARAVWPTANASTQSTQNSMVRLPINRELANEMRTFVRRHRVTLYALCHLAWSVVLQRRTGQSKLAVWGHYANRTTEELERLIGWFATSHIVGIELSEDRPISALINDITATTAASVMHQQLPTPTLLRHLAGSLGASRASHPAFDRARISLDVRRVHTSHVGPITITPVVVAAGLAGSMALHMMVMDYGDHMTLAALVSLESATDARVRQLLIELREALRQMVATSYDSPLHLSSAALEHQ